ncbi:hypothetical protein ACQUSR_00095 [Streptomyces sp. P1-3]|uniref:hypothetical protein n=1 Tax=Streptomyces sp. P1-3 TaxID=3421658 RepID=UPI003D3630CB
MPRRAAVWPEVRQRSLASCGELAPARTADLESIDPDWQLPHGPDWHRKYHLLRAHLAAGHDPATLHTATLLGTVKIGSWLTRQLTGFNRLDRRQQDLLTAIGLTPDTNPLTPARRTRRTFEQMVQLLELFLHRERRPPTAREEITVDGETVRIGPWFAKARTKKRAGQLSAEHDQLLAALFDNDWLDEGAAAAALA